MRALPQARQTPLLFLPEDNDCVRKQNVRHGRDLYQTIQKNNNGQTFFLARVPDTQSQHTDRLTNDRADTEKIIIQDTTRPKTTVHRQRDRHKNCATVHCYSLHRYISNIVPRAQLLYQAARETKIHSTNSSIISFPPLQHHQSPLLTHRISAYITENITVRKREMETLKWQCSGWTAITEYSGWWCWIWIP